MTIDFGALPPEVNSTRMYTGPGAGPMMAAAAAWNNLAAELNSTATAAQSVISTLADDQWRGPSSVAMATASAPYLEWLQTTSAAAQQAANQAMASAAAYEAAFGMTVPPPLVAANRAQLAALVATNLLGQNTPAIAANEAQYGAMWAQDAAAMYGYAGSSATAGRLVPLTDPQSAATPGAVGAQAGGTTSGLPGLVSNMPSTMQSLSGPLSAAASPAQALGPLGRFLRQQPGVKHPERDFRHGVLERLQRDRVRNPLRAHRRCGPGRSWHGARLRRRRYRARDDGGCSDGGGGCRRGAGVGRAGPGVDGRQVVRTGRLVGGRARRNGRCRSTLGEVRAGRRPPKRVPVGRTWRRACRHTPRPVAGVTASARVTASSRP